MNLLNPANIIQLLGIQNLPLEQKKKIIEMAVELVEVRLLNRVFAAVTEEKKIKIEKALEEQQKDTIFEVLKEEGIDFESLVSEETQKVKAELTELR